MKLEDAVLSLVEIFITRQHLVSDVIQTLRPDMFAIADKSISDIDLIEFVKKYAHVPQVGVWQNSEGLWEYYFHGNGCRLMHEVTGEVIDWDAPNNEMFDPWKFIYWIKWAVETKPKHLTDEANCLETKIKQDGELEALITNTLERFAEEGVFERSSQGRLSFN